ncbi:hypothetical protein [Staphylococcus simulans]|uniref:DNA-binding protein n=1 Tax=Staphylococcus simulans UMC-CNS-990 TaxID=1405498 RepID=A0ABN0PGE5_STASI|nr:hypothetical protein [Staphylococcus simulans]ERS94751.1 hypothetical protein SSIM_01260 [Staphylococcus simulans UMC-CNS-990]MCE5147834.1 hypothetical protein [Staphylococcus simulans]PTJ33210.1 hypothetical protein BU026_06160 [Staphylococcus simulans]UXR35318.1 hypothetical protein MUA31_13330 [Staphylococcus simulans]UXV37520.1 hypothetical protein MUA87_12260 [Staphylococcus simulans]
MLTKEFAQRVELSEKQVRKIVQHLEERGYHLKKTEYRGREATDFQEEDIELFREIADKVKQTNSYDLAFEELEKENDFLQIVVKEDDQNQLPSDQNFAKLLSDLHNDITKMREERQMLGQMISQVHQQQKDLQTLQQQMTDKLDQHEKTLKAIETAQKDQAKAVQDNTEAMKSHTEKVLAQPQPTVETKTEPKAEEQVAKTAEVKETKPSTEEVKTETTSSEEQTQKTTETPLSDYKGATASAETEQPTQTEPVKSESTSEQPAVDASETTKSENETPETEVQGTPNSTTPEPEIPIDNQHEPTVPHHKKEEKKGFFARLFGM